MMDFNIAHIRHKGAFASRAMGLTAGAPLIWRLVIDKNEFHISNCEQVS